MTNRRFITLSEVETETVQWLWRDRIPLGGITLIDGDPGDGKSSIMYDLAARITTGSPMPITGEIVGPAGVVLLQAEDLLGATVRPNLEAAGADVSRIVAYNRLSCTDAPLALDDSDDVETIKEAINAVDAKLVVIDPFTAFVGGNPNSEVKVRQVLGGLANVCEEKAVAVVIVRHLAKGGSPRSKYRGSGSIGIIAAARSAMLVSPDPSNEDIHQHVLSLNKSNLSDAASVAYRTVKNGDFITVEWLGEVGRSSEFLSNPADDGFEYSQLDEACYVLYSILVDYGQPMPAKEVQQMAADALVSPRTLKRAKKKLGVKSRRESDETSDDDELTMRWVWELPAMSERLKPFRERAIRELAQERIEYDTDAEELVIDQSTQTTSPTELSYPVWEDDTEIEAETHEELDLVSTRPWDE